jgi:hypothetical protein
MQLLGLLRKDGSFGTYVREAIDARYPSEATGYEQQRGTASSRHTAESEKRHERNCSKIAAKHAKLGLTLPGVEGGSFFFEKHCSICCV